MAECDKLFGNGMMAGFAIATLLNGMILFPIKGGLEEQRLYAGLPATVQYADINKDGRNDIIVSTNGGQKYIFLQDENGRYMSVSQIKEADKKELFAKTNALEQTIQRSLKSTLEKSVQEKRK